MSLEAIVAECLPSAEIFLRHDEEFFQDILRQRVPAIGIFAGEHLVAYSIIRIPGHSSKYGNLGRDINLPEEDLGKVAHLQAIAVHPAYRGNGLQRLLIHRHLSVAEVQGYKHICCTVSPKNPISLANMLSSGLLIEGLAPKFHDWPRFILHRDPSKEESIAEIRPIGIIEERIISISDLKEQLNLLQMGFKGFDISSQSGGYFISYGRVRDRSLSFVVVSGREPSSPDRPDLSPYLQPRHRLDS
jgi:GNAT superfamily N-acetyltransferase